jgi:hypothetical protein
VGFRLWVLFGFSVWLWLIVRIVGLGLLGFCLSFFFFFGAIYVYFLVYCALRFFLYIHYYLSKK